MNKKNTGSSRGFTLIELLTVIAIIGILAAIIIPTVGRVRGSAQAARCVSNLRQLALAAQMYGQDNKNRIVPWRDPVTKGGYWADSLLQYVSVRKGPSGDIEDSIFMCPVEKSNAAGETYMTVQRVRTRYSINVMITSTETGGKALAYNKIEYPAKTYLMVDLFGNAQGGTWMVPNLVYPHGEKVNVAFVDGHVEPKSQSQMEVYGSSANRAFWRGYNWDGSPSFVVD